MSRTKIIVVAVIMFGLVALYQMTAWTIARTSVPVGQSLMLRYKGPMLLGSRKYAKPGFFAEEGEIGVAKTLFGPGRYFYWPFWWETTIVDDTVILPGELGIVTCKLGEDLPNGEFLVDGDIGTTNHKGILRKALGPGQYRISPYAYEVKVVKSVAEQSGNQIKSSGWVQIPTGYVGVVTNLTARPKFSETSGIQPKIMPPGIYPVNGREQQVDIVKVGYRETTVQVGLLKNDDGSLKLDEAGEPIVSSKATGINFPSSDGFQINLDFTAIWGIMPDQAPHAVGTFGNVKQIEDKVVQPQIESICRNNGSEYSAVDLLVGEHREIYQKKTLEEFQLVLKEKQIDLLYGLVRHIYIPLSVRQPIQTAFVADELKLTREQEQLTAREEASLKEAEQRVLLETERVIAESERLCQKTLAEGDREAKKIGAETKRLTAAIAKDTAINRAEAKRVIGEAENTGMKLLAEAEADKFRLAVAAFGSSNAYTNWVFATGIPKDIDLKFFYAGPGTLWTDLKSLNVMAGPQGLPPVPATVVPATGQ